jgi:uncharacterized protein (TIGR00661 family)
MVIKKNRHSHNTMIIAYGVASEGMGHYTRSAAAIEYLIAKGHQVHIFTSDKVYDLMSKRFKNVHRIEGFHLVYHDGGLLSSKSTVRIIREIPKKALPTLRKIMTLFEEMQPDAIVSDFEPFVAMAARRMGLPLISANNISIVYKTKCVPPRLKVSYSTIIAGTAEYFTSLNPDYYVIPTFFFPKVRSQHVILTSPPIRDSILKKKSTVGGHILVYHTSDTAVDMLHLIRRIDLPFRVYGFGKRDSEKNITYHEFNEETFCDDLASAKAVITGGGFTLISEALHLKKPVFSIPLRKHAEQIINGMYLRKLKYGDYSLSPRLEEIQDFILKKELYDHYLKSYNPEINKFQETVEEIALHLSSKRSKYKLEQITP